MSDATPADQSPPIDYMRHAGGPLLISTLLASGAGRVSDASFAAYGSTYMYAIGGLTILGLLLTTAFLCTLLAATGFARGGSFRDGVAAWSLRASYLSSRATLALAVLMALSALGANLAHLLA